MTEASTKKSPAVYLVQQLAYVPDFARFCPDPLSDDITEKFGVRVHG